MLPASAGSHLVHMRVYKKKGGIRKLTEVAFYEDNPSRGRRGDERSEQLTQRVDKTARHRERYVCPNWTTFNCLHRRAAAIKESQEVGGIVAGFESLAVISRDLISAATVRFFSLGPALVKSHSLRRFFAYFPLLRSWPSRLENSRIISQLNLALSFQSCRSFVRKLCKFPASP